MTKIKVFDSQIHKSQKEINCHNCSGKILIDENYALVNLEKLKWNENVAICRKCFKLKKLEISQNE